MKRFLAILLLCWSWSAWTQPFLRNTFDTNQNLGFLITGTNFSVPGNISANGATYTNGVTILNDVLFVQSTAEFRMTGGEATGRFIVSDAAGVLNYTPGLTLLGGNTGTNLSLAGNLRANGGEFTNTLTLNGSPVSTNSGGISGTLTPGTVPVATGASTLGDSSITENGTTISSTNSTLKLGPDAALTDVTIQPNSVTGAKGNDLFFRGGNTTDGDGGHVWIYGADGVGTDKNGGNVSIYSGSKSGSASDGQITLSSLNMISLSSQGSIQAAATGPLQFQGSTIQLVNVTEPVAVYGALTLNNNTNQYTDDGTQLLRNGVPVGGGGGSLGVNGTNVTTPNLTNTATVTYALNGSNILATANVPAGTATASGTANTLAMFTSATNLGNSIVTQSGTNATIAGHLISQGNHTFSADNTYDIGASNATRARLIFAGTSFRAPDGSLAAPGFAFASSTNTGMFLRNSAYLSIDIGAVEVFGLTTTSLNMRDIQSFGWSPSSDPGAGQDAFFKREAAAVIQMGADSATPIGQIFKGADGSGSNIGGGNFTNAPGRGTGTGLGGTFYIATAGPGASGSSQNTLTNRFSVDGNGAVAISNITGTATLLTGLTSSNTLAGVGIGTGLAMSGTNLTATATGSGVTTQVTPLAYSGTNITGFDCTTNNMTYTLVLTNDCLFGSSTFVGLPNTTTNVFFTLALQQDSTGTRVPKFTNSIVKWSEGVQPVITTNANAVSYLYFHSHLFTNGMLVGTVNLNVK